MITNVGGKKPWFLDIQPGGRGHKRYQRKFRTKVQALSFETQIKNNVLLDESFVIEKKDNRKLQEFIKIWYQETGKFLNSGSDIYQRMLNASSLMGSPIARTIKPHLFLAYRSKRIEDGLKPATLNKELQAFKTVFTHASSSGHCGFKNPFINIKKIKTNQPKTVFLSDYEIKNLFFHLKKADSDAYLISLICLSTGARWGEAQSLTKSDLSNNMVHFHETKSKRSRSIPIDDSLMIKLNNRLNVSHFTDSYSTFTRRLYDSGIELPKGQRTHILRHTFASHFIINGGHIRTLQEILGHSSLNMTMRYSHLSPDCMVEILEKNPGLMFC